MLLYGLQLLALASTVVSHTYPKCKATPGSKGWPSSHEWSRFNKTLSGKLIKPSPPGAACHPDQSTYDPSACPAIQAGWKTSVWHTQNPVSSIVDNYNNDTCLPIPEAPCSGEGYPIYVVNATTAQDVKKGVDFARKHDIRLIVKGTGHDYLGRSSAPNALSIWTHHLKGMSFHDGFKPKRCSHVIKVPAITVAAGVQMLEIDEQAHLRNLTIVSGGSGTVGVGGYLTGGGHGALSSTYGMAADQVLEMEIVTPGGDILTINECQNTDLFWAMRGGGGSTFGVLTSVTVQAHKSPPLLTANFYFATKPSTSTYFAAAAAFVSQYPALSSMGISGYSYLNPNADAGDLNITAPVEGVVAGVFILPVLSPANTSASLTAALTEALDKAMALFPDQFDYGVQPVESWDDFWGWYKINNGPLQAGGDGVMGSRLLDEKALTSNITALEDAFKQMGRTRIDMNFVSGKGSHPTTPRGGGNAVNDAWRRTVIHALMTTGWAPFDAAEKAKQEDLTTHKYVPALRKLAPDTGAYLNEADPNEPDFQESFWGKKYERLLAIKKKVDPGDVLWCHPCVGSEGWKVVGNVLCRV